MSIICFVESNSMIKNTYVFRILGFECKVSKYFYFKKKSNL